MLFIKVVGCIFLFSRMMSIIVLTFLLLNMPRCVIGLFEATRYFQKEDGSIFSIKESFALDPPVWITDAFDTASMSPRQTQLSR